MTITQSTGRIGLQPLKGGFQLPVFERLAPTPFSLKNTLTFYCPHQRFHMSFIIIHLFYALVKPRGIFWRVKQLPFFEWQHRSALRPK